MKPHWTIQCANKNEGGKPVQKARSTVSLHKKFLSGFSMYFSGFRIDSHE
jgi:hypothetical protein